MAYQFEQGYLIPAVNTHDTDYVSCARALARSLKYWHPKCHVTLLTDAVVQLPEFDHVETLPYGNLNGWANDWQVYHASPYHETIKLEADMIVSGPIDHWWSALRNRDVVVSVGALDHRGRPARSRRYRRVFDENHLPDLYNAVTYWRVSRAAMTFFQLVRQNFEHWDQVRLALRGGQDHEANTDLVYAVTAEMLGRESVTVPLDFPRIVHMKPDILGIGSQDWTQELVWEIVDGVFRVNGHAQQGLVHYNKKSLAQEFIRYYE